MIERHWGGIAKANMVDDYVKYLKLHTLPDLQKIVGFKHASVLRRKCEDGVQFLVVTLWDSEEAIRKFAGEDSEVAVVPETVKTMMVRFDPRASHFEYAE